MKPCAISVFTDAAESLISVTSSTRFDFYEICYVQGQKIPFLARIANSIKVRLQTTEFCKSEIQILLNGSNNNIYCIITSSNARY